MNSITITGRLGKDAETRQAGSTTVTGFNCACDTGFGDRKQTLWFSCSVWGKRGEALQQHLVKGTQVTIVGELTHRDYNEKTYLEINVNEIAMQG